MWYHIHRMRYAIIADIHANLSAFIAVLRDIERRGQVDELWCLGDVVGYGPDPGQCIELLRRSAHVCIAGNHDMAAVGRLDLANFNPDAATTIRWTREHICEEDAAYLAGLPSTIKVAKEGITLAHGSPKEPVWEYLVSLPVARDNFACFDTAYCMVGHSHTSLIFRQAEGVVSYIPFTEDIGQALGKNRLIINPGSVGQPRDGDPRASYAIYDTEAGIIRLHRVEYDITATQQNIMRYNLPLRLSVRLSQGV